ncbi:molybdopterin molybdotransferase [Murinocardiopsis flavida]|uniref:Molybdopterin molybdenumtransferase n=2 Tax=Murinocardiopsis flavida TaxID=645275 RepID=A0A2P8DKT4_9ACTN|nr:molybdopterin molybdotransferase [Murinocardiopsis flavida]
MAWSEARTAARECGRAVGPVPGVRVAVADAAGAALDAELAALAAVPPFDAAAMDGFAVAGPGPWTLSGRLLAGAAPAPSPLAPGQAVEIATGARVPPGTAAVLPYEDAEHGSEKVHGEIAAGRHIRRAGQDVARGASVLPAGSVVTPAVLGLAASLGHDTIAVRRPRVAVLVTGDEIAASGVPGGGRVRDAIGPMLPGLAAWAGAAADPVVRLGDDRAALVAGLQAALDGAGADVVAVCGSSSRGPADHLRAALAEIGAAVLVDGVACRPGHPQMLARARRPGADDAVVVGLPGNPYAAVGAALTLLVPALCALAGRPEPGPPGPERLPVAGEVPVHPDDTRLVAVSVRRGRAVPVGHDRPGALLGAALADGVAVIPPGWTGPDAELLRLPG